MIILSPAGARLSDLLRTRHGELLERWVARVHEAPRYRERPIQEIRSNADEVLRGIERWIADGESSAIDAAAAGLARRREAGDFAQADVIEALLLGRETIVEECRRALSDADVVATASVLDTAFDRVVSGFSSTFCTLCRDRQDDRRLRLERQLESVVDRSLDAMIFFDQQRAVRVWNPGAERLFGWRAADMIGHSLDRIVPPERLADEEIVRLMGAVRESGHVRLAETQRRRADDSLVWVDVAFTAVRDRSGEVAGIWAVFRDVGERKRLEEEKLQAERLALIGTMSAKLAHEVRNPLGSLVLGLDLIRDNLRALEPVGGDAVRETQDLVGSIESEMQRIRTVVEHYLQFARLPTLSLKPVALDEVLRTHLDLLRAELDARGARLDLRLDASAPVIRADEAQIWQAVLNLVRNAVDAMPAGGTVTVTTRRAGARWECEIADTGGGIDEEVRASMYRPFFSTKRSGTGLGLPLTQQIVHEHGGTLTCHSVPGAGTRFVIGLPLADPRPVTPAEER
jgi:PAS domain S-box-containing protein